MKILKTHGSSDIRIIDSDGTEQDIYYGPDKGKNIVNTFYWYNDLQGRLKQELRPPAPYHGQPRMYIKEDIERIDENELISHLRIFYGKQLLAETDKSMPEYTKGFLNNEDNDLRFSQIRATVNYLLNENGWKLHKIGDESRFRKVKKIVPKTRKVVPIKTKKPVKKIKKVVLKKPKPKKRK